MRTRLVSLLFVCCIVGSAVGAVAPPAEAGPSSAGGDAEIAVTRHYANADGDDGNVTVEVTYEFADAAVGRVPSELLAPGTEVLSTSGFTVEERGGRRVAVWDGESTTATIRFRRPVEYLVVGDEGDGWALLNTFRGEDYYGQYPVNLTVTGAPAATFDGRTVLVGAHETYRADVGNHRLLLVVPAAAEPPDSPKTILAAMRYTGRRLGGGPGMRGETVAVFVKPEWAGQVVPDDDFVIGDETATVTEPGGAYIEEYGHLLQPSNGGPSMDWMVDGYAMYYDHYYPLKRDATPNWTAFRDALEPPGRVNHSVVLADRSTWDHRGVGARAMAVLAALDVRIQRATDGEKHLRDVFARMYDRRDDVSAEEFQRLAETVAGREFDDFFDRYVFGGQYPTLPEEPPSVYLESDPVATSTPTPASSPTPTSSPAAATASPTATAGATASPGTAGSPTGTTTTGAGFGPAVALLALVVLAVVAGGRD